MAHKNQICHYHWPFRYKQTLKDYIVEMRFALVKQIWGFSFITALQVLEPWPVKNHRKTSIQFVYSPMQAFSKYFVSKINQQ